MITYLETMVFVLDSVNAHTAAALVAQEAIAIIPTSSNGLGCNQLLRELQLLTSQISAESCAQISTGSFLCPQVISGSKCSTTVVPAETTLSP